jgi:hypothetical protein
VDADHGASLGPQAAQHFDDRFLGRRIDAREGFIHKIEIGFLGERSGEEDSLLLSAGKLGDLPVGERFHLHLSEAGASDFAISARHAAEPADAPIASHANDIEG